MTMEWQASCDSVFLSPTFRPLASCRRTLEVTATGAACARVGAGAGGIQTADRSARVCPIGITCEVLSLGRVQE